MRWRELSPADLERHFNPRVAVADAQSHLDRFAARSAEARSALAGSCRSHYDVRYGERPKETLDLHAADGAGDGRPLVLFVHGGYWRALDKSDHSFVVPPLLASGAVVANVNYDLCPTVTLDDIVDEIANAVRYCHRHAATWGADPGNLHLVGHSAGAHLAAEMLLREWGADDPAGRSIRGVGAITGIYEPEIILGVSVNEEARIAPEIAARRSCLDRPFRLRPRVVVGVGGGEPGGWIAQSEAFAAACVDAGMDTRYETVAGANHFTALERALAPGEALCDAMLALWS